MSNLFREMMPDNFLELAFTGGLTFSIAYTSLNVIKYYKNKGLSVKEIEAQYKRVLKEKDEQIKNKEIELLSKLNEIRNNYESKLKSDTLSDNAKDFLKAL